MRRKKDCPHVLSVEDAAHFYESVDQCVRAGLLITQGVHDTYVRLCVSESRKITHVAGSRWVKCPMLSLEGTTLKWAGGPVQTEHTDSMIADVNYAIKFGVTVSQGVHNHYVQTCVTKGIQPLSIGAVDSTGALNVVQDFDQMRAAVSRGPMCGAIGPRWTRGEIEAPKGEKNMGTWTAAVYTAEQQAHLGVDETGQPVKGGTAASSVKAPNNNNALTFKFFSEESCFDFCQREGKKQASGGSDEGLRQALEQRNAQQMAKIEHMKTMINKEMTRQIADRAEIQKLKIASATLRVKNAKIRQKLGTS